MNTYKRHRSSFTKDYDMFKLALAMMTVAVTIFPTSAQSSDIDADRGQDVVPRFTISTVAGTGKRGMSGDGGPATDALIGRPSAVALDAYGSVYIAEFFNHRIRKITTDGTITTIAGTGTPGYNGDGGPAEKAQTSNPDIIAFGPNGNLFIPDHLNAVVRKLTRAEN